MASSDSFDSSALSAKQVAQIHKNADTDGSTKAIHHTIGPGQAQAAAGNHTHDGGQSALVDAANLNPLPLPAWTAMALSGGWVSYDAGATFAIPAYRLENNRAYASGLMKHAVTTTTGTFFTLPVGYRPVKQHAFNLAVNGGSARVDVFPSGIMSLAGYISPGSGAFVSLEFNWPIDY